MSDPPAPALDFDEPTRTETEVPPPRPSLTGPRFAPGTTVGHYELIRQIGQGGMGEVYLARDTRLGRRVALKFLLKVDRKQSARFLVEARTTAQLTHENIVALYDIGEHDGLPYMVLEYVPGTTLSTWLRNRRENPATQGVPPTRAAELMLPVARALQCAQEAGIVHRDLKPGNIMLSENGTVKVLDFGIAKLMGDASISVIAGLDFEATQSRIDLSMLKSKNGQLPAGLTEAGVVIGTRAYMAPEQWWGEPIDGRTDIWAVGVILFQMVTGDHPFSPLSPESLAFVADRETPMPSIRDLFPDVGRLGTVIDRCLIKYKDDRLASARELVEQLEAIVRPHRTSAEEGSEEANPFAGLAAFQERDAARFFGRETMVEQIVSRLVEQPLLALVGASGAGKSSLVRAGVIPALRRGGDAWESFIMRPGPRPLAALSDMLHQHSWQRSSHTADSGPSSRNELGDNEAILTRLRQEPGYLGVQVRARARRRRERALLFIDQFEEVYTLAAEDEREAFLRCLAGVADDPSSPVRVLVSIRHDFLDRVALGSSTLAELVSRGTVLVGPLDRAGLQQALVAPAEASGYRFESETLVAEMLDTLGRTTGALPLLQFTASRLWAGRDIERRMLTESCYRAFGGVEGALTSHADSVISGMTETEKNWARVLILRLVTPEHTRAIATRRELSEIGGTDVATVERVLGKLVDARLLVVESIRGGESTVELVHESLIERWPRLSMWLDEADDFAQFRGRLRTAAKEWEANHRSDGLVWRGDAAEETRRFWKTHGERGAAELNARETAYVEAVLALQDRERRIRRTLVIGGFAILVFVVFIVSSLAVQSRTEAERAQAGEMEAQAQRNEARAQKAEAERSASRARNVTRMAAAGHLQKDPLTMLALLREIESGDLPRGWQELAMQALAAPDLASIAFTHDDARYAAWSPDGKRIASASNDKTVKVWNVDGSGEPIVYRRHTQGVRAVAWSPDGKRIASGSSDKTVHVWNADGTGEPIVFQTPESQVFRIAWHSDGKRLFSAGRGGVLGMWNIDGPGKTVKLDARYGDLITATWSPDFERVVTGGQDGKIHVWSMDLKSEPTILGAHEDAVWIVAWSADGQRIVTAANDGSVKVWNADGSGKPIQFAGYRALRTTVAISPDSRTFVMGGDTSAFKMANMDGAGVPIELHTGNDFLTLVYSPDGQHILSVERNGVIHVWNVKRTTTPRVLRGHKEGVYGAAWSPDGTRIASAAHDNTLRIWNAHDLTAEPIIFEYSSKLSSLAWSPDGKRVVTGAEDGTVAVWVVDSREKPLILRGHEGLVLGVAWNPDGLTVASCGSDASVRIWNADGTGAPRIFRHVGATYTVAFSPDGKRIVSASKDSTARIWNVDGTGDPIVLQHEVGVYGAVFSPDGKFVVTGAIDRILRLWNADGSGKLREFKGHESVVSVRGMRVFTSDGQRLVSSSDDGTVGIWNIDGSGAPLFLRSSNDAVNMADLSPDGKRIATASDDGNVTIWNDLTPLTGPDDPRLWAPTRYCMPLDVRRKLLDSSDEQAHADLARCQAHAQKTAQ
ncbi:MAG TPA: protein kinase [Polyangium sp.]|nr:protein kinase [Polyangium sp.]